MIHKLLNDLYLFEDTCNVYVIRSGREAVLIDFGSGDVLDHLHEFGVDRITDVLMTHHHRDQAQGLQRASNEGIRIWVPETEQDLFHSVDAHWQSRQIINSYNVRQDRFSLLESVPVNGLLQDYAIYEFGGRRFTIVPTPGHTTGSITFISNINGQSVAFSGDLIAEGGKVWSLSATQWTYNGAEGAPATIASLLDLKDRRPDLLLPSHGAPISEIDASVDLLVDRFSRFMQLRDQNRRFFQLREKPYEAITPHLLKHRASMANTYVLLSESGKALIFDFGYDFHTGFVGGEDRASRRPWLYTIPALKAQFSISKIDVVLPTHYHDDHVAGFNVLRRVEGAQVWAAESFADILEHPADYDLPCLWYDPIPVDRRLPVGTSFQWEEYTLTQYPLPGHTRHAVAILVEVDGQRVLVTGDQYQGSDGLEFNYVYANQFNASDYVASAMLYRQLDPHLILTGHWEPLTVTPEYLEQILVKGRELEALHRELLPAQPNLDEEGFAARLRPYRSVSDGASPIEFSAEVRNPYDCEAHADLRIVMPDGWTVVEPAGLTFEMQPLATQTIRFHVLPPPTFNDRRTRIAVDVTINGRRFGQQAEALISFAPQVQAKETRRNGSSIGA